MNAHTDPLLDPRLRPYLKDVQAWHGYVRFLGLPTLQDHPDTAMHELFVPPLLAKTFVSPDSDTAHWPQGQPVLATLREAKRLVVLGDPGSGKSTLVDWLAWLLVSGVEERVPDWLRRFIPLPFVLREMELGGVKNFDGLLESFLKHPVALHLRGQKDLLVELLKAGRVLVLADGLDEVGGGQRESLRDALWDGFSKYSESYFLATSRIVGYEDCPIEWQKQDLPNDAFQLQNWRIDGRVGPRPMNWRMVIERCHIMPFDDNRIRDFAVNWYRLRSLRPIADSDAEQFITALFRDKTTRRLARNPQLLTLMALVYRVRAHLPDGRALLYDLIAEAYLESIDKARNISTSAADAAPWQEKRRWLARVGFEMQFRRTAQKGQEDKNSSSYSWERQNERELLATRTEVLGWLAEATLESGYSANPGFVDSYLHWVARRSGLLLPRGEEQFAFVHLSFQEYFAALYLCEYLADADWVLAQREGQTNADGDTRVSAANLLAWANNPSWQETLVFCFESFAFQPKDAKRLVGWLFGDNYEGFLNNLNPGKPPKESPRAELLARLLVDPHSGLTFSERNLAFDAIWRYLETAERRFELDNRWVNPKVLNRLLSAPDWSERFWKRLAASSPIALDLISVFSLDLKTLSILTSLQLLVLDFSHIKNLSFLEKLTDLRQIYFNRTSIDDLSPLRKLKKLQELKLAGTHVTKLDPLVELSCLKLLDISDTSITDISPLAGLYNLIELCLDRTPVKDLSPLVNILGLRKLSLWGVQAPIPPELRQREGLKIAGP